MGAPSRRLLLPLIALTSPLSLGLETGLRTLLFTRDMIDLRAMARPTMTPIAWGAAALTLLAVFVGVGVHRAAFAHALESRDARDPAAVERARLQALYVASSVPQVPALVATLLFTAGSELAPVAVSLALSAVGVMVMGATAPR